jgi:hypothetical protein
VSKKLQAKQERRVAEQRRREAQRKAARRGNLVTGGIIAVVVAVVVALIGPELLGRNAAVGVAPGEAGCTGIKTHPEEGKQHVEAGTKLDYDTAPPTSGDHYDTPADFGFYTSPIAPEALVHNLEHGQIVIWYRPDAPQGVVDDIDRLTGQDPTATVAAPYQGVPEGANFSVTAWRASMDCELVSQELVDRFRTRFQGRGPERVPGIPTFEG